MLDRVLISFAVATLVAVTAAVVDVRSLRIPNTLTATTFALGLAFHVGTAGTAGWTASLAGAATGFGLLIVFYVVGGFGAGDVKLLAALGAWLGPQATFFVFVISSVVMGGIALVRLGAGRWRQRRAAAPGPTAAPTRGWWTGWTVAEIAQDPTRRSRLVPFAPSVLVGVAGVFAVVLIESHWGG